MVVEPERRRKPSKEIKHKMNGSLWIRVARFFLVSCQNGVNIPNDTKIHQMAAKYTKWPQNTPNGRKIHQMTAKYIHQKNTKYAKWPQNTPKGYKMHQNGHYIDKNFTVQGPSKSTQIGILVPSGNPYFGYSAFGSGSKKNKPCFGSFKCRCEAQESQNIISRILTLLPPFLKMAAKIFGKWKKKMKS
jgi:hypothetical protein